MRLDSCLSAGVVQDFDKPNLEMYLVYQAKFTHARTRKMSCAGERDTRAHTDLTPLSWDRNNQYLIHPSLYLYVHPASPFLFLIVSPAGFSTSHMQLYGKGK